LEPVSLSEEAKLLEVPPPVAVGVEAAARFVKRVSPEAESVSLNEDVALFEIELSVAVSVGDAETAF
jgi:hypothetical protein